MTDKGGEDWVIVSNAPTTPQIFTQYRLKFQVEESFLNLKSNGFNQQVATDTDRMGIDF